jgi:hypothetical protein
MKYLALITIGSLIGCATKTQTSTENPVVKEVASEVAPTPERIDVSKTEHFGLEFTLADSVPAGNILENPDAFVGQTVRITGKVSDVCQKMGCWMVITDSDKHMRITTKDHKFFVAKDGAGAQCDLEGVVVKRDASPARTEHFKSEQSEGAPMPEGETTGTATYEIVASTISLTR